MSSRFSLTRLCLAPSLGLVLAAAAGCGEDGGSKDVEFAPTVATYAKHVSQNYEEVLTKAKALQIAVDAFVAAPSATTLTAAKDAWKDARPLYGQTEVYRFYDGPIDAPMTGPEGAINGWPLDENYVDYTADEPMAGIINDAVKYPDLTPAALGELNEKGGEKNLATGWHAIEFLLWGQDASTTGPGERPFTDYLATGGTAANQARRGAYLKAVTQLLVDDLTTVATAWKPATAGNYAANFGKDAKVAVRNMLTGIGSLAGGELSRERMNNAYQTKEQEEEHSCFSDTTTIDLVNGAIGIENVYLGRFGSDDGAGIDDLVKGKNAALDTEMKTLLAAMVNAMKAVPQPFDQAILGDNTAAGRIKVKAAIDATKAVAERTVAVAQALGIKAEDLNIDNGDPLPPM